MLVMKDQKFNSSDVLTSGMDFSMEEIQKYGDATRFMKIRDEMSRFLINLNQSHIAKSTGQQIHFLFMAQIHLENLDREIRISTENEEIIRLEIIHEKIRSLKALIQGYIKQLAAG